MTMLQAQRTKKSFYPEKLRRLYTPECIEYRKDFNKRLWDYFHLHSKNKIATPSERAFLKDVQSAHQLNVSIPFQGALRQMRNPLDVIAVFIEYMTRSGKRKSIGFMEHYTYRQKQEGAGKTGIALRLMGIKIPYNKIPRPRYDTISAVVELTKKIKTKKPQRFSSQHVRCRLISSDLAYIGLDRFGKITAASLIAEPFAAQWNLGRHLSRMTHTFYIDDTGRKIPEKRAHMDVLGRIYYLAFGQDGVFTKNDVIHNIDEIFIMRRNSGSRRGVKISRPISRSNVKEVLKDILLKNPPESPSPFWFINRKEHKRRVLNIIRDITHIPRIRYINITASKDQYPVDQACTSVQQAIEE